MRLLIAWTMLLLLCGRSLLFSAEPSKSEPQTLITCKGPLDMDYEKDVAIFHDDVLVDDPRMRMTADKMTVHFRHESREIEKVVAEGRVRFHKEERSAKAERALYTAQDGKVVLTGHPMVKKGEDFITGDKITFYRDDSRMLVEPRARLILRSSNPQEGEDWL